MSQVERLTRDRRMLHQLAAQLQPPPEQLPYYVGRDAGPGELLGWYYVPAGGEGPIPLGSNVFNAEARLIELLHTNAAA